MEMSPEYCHADERVGSQLKVVYRSIFDLISGYFVSLFFIYEMHLLDDEPLCQWEVAL